MLNVIVTLSLTCIVCAYSQVLRLTASTLYDEIKIQSLLMVSFHAPWCGHCITLNEVLEKVAVQLHDANISARVATIDATTPDMIDIIEIEKIDGYPTVVVYRDGDRIGEYKSQRSEKDIFQYLKAKSGPIADFLPNVADLVPHIAQLDKLESFERGIFSIVVAVFLPNEMGEDKGLKGGVAKIFHQVAKQFDLARFFYTDTDEFIKEFNLELDALLVFTGDRHDTFHKIELTPSMSEDMITQQIIQHSLPIVIPLTFETKPLLQQLPVKSHALAFYDVSGSDELFLDTLLMVAPLFKGRIQLVEVASDDYTVMNYFGIRTSDLPQLVVMDMSDDEDTKRYDFVDYLATQYLEAVDEDSRAANKQAAAKLKIKKVFPRSPLPNQPKQADGNKKVNSAPDSKSLNLLGPSLFKSSEDLKYFEEEVDHSFYYNKKRIEEFFSAYLRGDAVRSLQSEDIAVARKLNDMLVSMSPNVENIVGVQFHDKVNKMNIQDILVYFYAPWCIHCKALEPVIADIANRLKDDSSFKLYRIDGSKNEVVSKGVKIYAFPTIYFFPRNDFVVDCESSRGDGIGDNTVLPKLYNGDRSVESLLQFIEVNRQRVDVKGECMKDEESLLSVEQNSWSSEEMEGSSTNVLSDIIESLSPTVSPGNEVLESTLLMNSTEFQISHDEILGEP